MVLLTKSDCNCSFLSCGCTFSDICWIYPFTSSCWGLSWWPSGKESAWNAGNMSLIPELGRSPRGGNGNPLQYSCLGNPMGRGARRPTVHTVAKSWTRLSMPKLILLKFFLVNLTALFKTTAPSGIPALLNTLLPFQYIWVNCNFLLPALFF